VSVIARRVLQAKDIKLPTVRERNTTPLDAIPLSSPHLEMPYLRLHANGFPRRGAENRRHPALHLDRRDQLRMGSTKEVGLTEARGSGLRDQQRRFVSLPGRWCR
jgi:hypothetical protein